MTRSDPGDRPEAPLAGIELGGTKCVCTIAYHPDHIIDQRVVSTTTPSETLPAIAAILRDWDGAHGIRAIGVAAFGPLELNPAKPSFGRVLATNKPGWPDAPVLQELTGSFDVPVGFDTDVNGAALAEITWGCANGLSDFAYVTVGTGVGVGLIVNGRPTRGIGHAEIGHLRVPRLPGDIVPSVCRYHDDCVEGLASGTALVSRLAGRSVASAAADDPVWDPMVATLAAMCHSLVVTSGPSRIAIGGGVMTGQPHLLARIEAVLIKSLGGYMSLPADGPYVVAPRLGDQAGPLGAIVLAEDAVRSGTHGHK